MKYSNFILRLISLGLIAASLLNYNAVASERQALVEERQERIAEVEAYNESILAAENEAESGPSYIDGTYEGIGMGFGGEVVVSVTITEGKIGQVTVLSAKDEDEAYFSMAEVLTEKIVRKQSTEIDTVSGATFSSKGILEGAAAALGKAVK